MSKVGNCPECGGKGTVYGSRKFPNSKIRVRYGECDNGHRWRKDSPLNSWELPPEIVVRGVKVGPVMLAWFAEARGYLE